MTELVWAPGAVLPFGRLVRLLDVGATAEVWEAEGVFGPVAVKALHPALIHQPGFAALLPREARACRLVAHPALVPVLADGCVAGRPYLVFPLLRGQLLADSGLARLKRARVARLLAGPAQALDQLHAAGLIHGDVKPGNLFLEENGAVRLLDLGAARMTTESPDWQPGLPEATPRWTAPERLRGEPPDASDDVYSLALIAKALLADPPTRAMRAALGPRVGRPGAEAMVRSLRPVLARWRDVWRG